MQRERYKIFSAAMVAFACLGCHRQQVYSLNVGSFMIPSVPIPSPVIEHNWTVSIATYSQGFYQSSQWVDSHEEATYPMVNGKPTGAVKRTDTTIFFGIWYLTVRAPAWPFVAIGLGFVSLTAWLLVSATGSFRRRVRRGHDPP